MRRSRKTGVRGAGPFYICRHGPNDPSCSSHKDYRDPYAQSYGGGSGSSVTTPDKKNFKIRDYLELHDFLLLKVEYPNCKKCEYEGLKVLVFKGVSMRTALRRETIDPHFRDPLKSEKWNEAPTPVARFPASEEGWKDAQTFVTAKLVTSDAR